jgi:transaldolase
MMAMPHHHRRLQRVAALGQSVWVDYLSRDMLCTGELACLMREHAVTGATSNPTLLERAIRESAGYDEALAELGRLRDAKALLLALAVTDARDACDALATVHAASAGADGWVSLEVDPRLADDAAATLAEAAWLRTAVARPNLLVKIPATEAGIEAVEMATAAGIPVNVTLLFSLGRHRAAAEAYIAGLERFVLDGGDPARIISVASFFVSRVDTETDRRLARVGAGGGLAGRLAIANARLAYETFKEFFDSKRWQALHALGASPQRCLWASTSAKNPAYRDVRYVEELIGPDTVTTLPRETIFAFEDHGRVEVTLERDLDEAKAMFERVAAVGIDYDDVTNTLEQDGVARFVDSYHALLALLDHQRRRWAA